MTLPLVVASEAQEELDESYAYYERQRAGLGLRFLQSVEAVFRRITATPRMHATTFLDVRKAPVPGFPFCVYYAEEQSCIRVISVFHMSRDPSIWQARR